MMRRLIEGFMALVAVLLAGPVARNWLIKRAEKTPYFHIYGSDGSAYIERYWLFNPVDRETNIARFRWIPFSIRLHRIHREDMDRHPHDHPWHARSFILSGGYVEVRRDRAMLRLAGTSYALRPGEFHRIAQVCEGGAVTLFITGRRSNQWGFWVNGRKVASHLYFQGENQ